MQCFRCISDLFKVNATDKDSLQNGYGEVLYYILHSSSGSGINIDSISGEINVTQPIADDIEISVEACDNPTQQSSRYAILYCYCYVLIKLWNKQTNKQTNKWEWYWCYSAFNVLCIYQQLDFQHVQMVPRPEILLCMNHQGTFKMVMHYNNVCTSGRTQNFLYCMVNEEINE